MYVWRKLSSARWKDAWEERFYGRTNSVIQEVPGRESIRLEVYCRSAAEAESIREQFGGSVRRLRQRNWAGTGAGRSPAPIKIRDCLLITSSDSAAVRARLDREHPGRQVISIPGEMAFGTGRHATTASCLRRLADLSGEWNRKGDCWDLLDLGTGSGILAIAGKLLGARRVTGVEFDAQALLVAKRNAARHGLSRKIRFLERDLLSWDPGPQDQYDAVVANLYCEVLKSAFPKIAAVTRPGGRVVISGILADQADECLAAARREGIDFPKVFRRGRWVTALGSVRKRRAEKRTRKKSGSGTRPGR